MFKPTINRPLLSEIFTPAYIFSLTISFLLVGGLAGQLRWWTDDGFIVAGAFRYVALIALPLLAYSIYQIKSKDIKAVIDSSGFASGLILIFFSSWLDNDYSLLHGSAIRGEIIIFSLLMFLLSVRVRNAALYCLAIATPFILIWSFSQISGGRLIFSDDHAVMVYRLNLLKQNFPNIPHYNPLWNCGIDARDFFATGVLNVYFFFYPLIALFKVEQIYNSILALTVFAIMPSAVYLATRLLNQSSKAAAIASIIAISSNLLWYRWVLKYGAIGFIFSSCILPLVVALFFRFLYPTKIPKKLEQIAFVILSCLMLFWSPTALFLLPLAFFILFNIKDVFKRRDAWITFGVIGAITIPWVLVFISVSGVSNFVSTPAVTSQVELKEPREASITRALKGGKALLSPSSVINGIREAASKANPLIVIFALPGLIFLRDKKVRALLLSLTLWLLLLGTIGNALKPQLELDRALIVLGILLSIPAAVALEDLIEKSNSSARARFLPAVAGGFLLAGVFATSNVIYNRSAENYTFTEEIFDQLPAAVLKFGGAGRTVFPGFILHEFNSAHVAPVALMTNHPMVASSPFHNLWWYTELVPGEFLEKGETGIEQYFDLINATSVIVHEPRWRYYFATRPESYTLKWRWLNFSLFARKHAPATYFLEGEGRILSQNSNSIQLIPDSQRVVIKFNYFKFLTSSACQIKPHAIENSKLNLIELDQCPVGQPVTIQAQPAWRRIL